MNRGEIWRYQPVAPRPGQPNLRLIVSANIVNDDNGIPIVLALHVVDRDPESLLAPRVGEYGWARVLSIEPVMRSRFTERVAVVEPETMDGVNAALRVAQDL